MLFADRLFLHFGLFGRWILRLLCFHIFFLLMIFFCHGRLRLLSRGKSEPRCDIAGDRVDGVRLRVRHFAEIQHLCLIAYRIIRLHGDALAVFRHCFRFRKTMLQKQLYCHACGCQYTANRYAQPTLYTLCQGNQNACRAKAKQTCAENRGRSLKQNTGDAENHRTGGNNQPECRCKRSGKQCRYIDNQCAVDGRQYKYAG